MRQWLSIILLVLVLALPFALRAALSKPTTLPSPNTKRLVIITANTQDIRRAFADAFAKWYRQKFGSDVIIDYRVPGGGNDILRQLRTTYLAAQDAHGNLHENFHPDLDMVWGGGDYFFAVELKNPINVLEPMNIDPALLQAAFPNPTLAGVKLYDYHLPNNSRDSTSRAFSPSPGTPGEGRGGGSSSFILDPSSLKSTPTLTLPRSSRGRNNTQQPTWVGLCLSSMGIIFNPDLYQALALPPPKQWQDLSNPKLTGLVALADPSHSASVALAYMMVVQRAMADSQNNFFASHPSAKSLDKSALAALPAYQSALAAGWQTGMETLQRIAANARYFTAWGSQVPNDVGSGDAAAGIAIDFYGRVYEEEVGSNRCQFIAPLGATSTTPDPIAILAGVRGEQYELANHFIEFLLSKDGQRLWITKTGAPGGPAERSLRRLPIRRDVYADQQNWTDHVNPFASAQGFNQRNDWMSLFTDMRILWTAAWIDCREELRSAHSAIMQVQDPNRRDELLTRLAQLPVSMNDLSHFASERRQLQKQPDADLAAFAAKEEITLAAQFRAHYQTIQHLAATSRGIASAISHPFAISLSLTPSPGTPACIERSRNGEGRGEGIHGNKENAKARRREEMPRRDFTLKEFLRVLPSRLRAFAFSSIACPHPDPLHFDFAQCRPVCRTTVKTQPPLNS